MGATARKPAISLTSDRTFEKVMRESVLASLVLDWFRINDYIVIANDSLAPIPLGLRERYDEVVLNSMISGSMCDLNEGIPNEMIEVAQNRLLNPTGETLQLRKENFHRMLNEGVSIPTSEHDEFGDTVNIRVIDYEQPLRNSWLVAREVKVEADSRSFRFDLVVFINGLPLALIEIRSGRLNENELESAYESVRSASKISPMLYISNEIIGICDGAQAKIGRINNEIDDLKSWIEIDNQEDSSVSHCESQVMIQRAFEKTRLLSLIRNEENLF